MSETWRKSPIFLGSFQDQGCLCQLNFSWDLDLPGLVHGGVDLLGPTVVPEQVKPRYGLVSWVRCRVAVAIRGRFGVPTTAFQQVWVANKEKEVNLRRQNNNNNHHHQSLSVCLITLPCFLPSEVYSIRAYDHGNPGHKVTNHAVAHRLALSCGNFNNCPFIDYLPDRNGDVHS